MDKQTLLMLPGPTNVPPRVMRAMIKPMINHRGPEFEEMYEALIENLKLIFETRNDIVVLSASGTGGVECAIANLLSRGDKMIVAVNGVFSQRVKETVEAYGAAPMEIPVKWGSAVKPREVEGQLQRNPDAKAVAVVYNETSTGVTTRTLKEVGDICKDRGVLFVVDAISILGGDKLPVDEWSIDFCITGSQKCLMTPPGLSVVSVSDKAWSVIEKAKTRYYFDLLAYRKFYQDRRQTPYTPAVPLLFALDEAVKMIKEEGMKQRIRRHEVCAEATYAALEALHISLPAEPESRSHVVIAANNPPGISDEMIRKQLLSRYNIAIAGGMGKLKGTMFRIGVMGMVDEAMICTTVTALEAVLADLKYEFKAGEGLAAAKEVFARNPL